VVGVVEGIEMVGMEQVNIITDHKAMKIHSLHPLER